jgi:hypothetical protein
MAVISARMILFPLEHDPEKWKPVFGKNHAQMAKLFAM